MKTQRFRLALSGLAVLLSEAWTLTRRIVPLQRQPRIGSRFSSACLRLSTSGSAVRQQNSADLVEISRRKLLSLIPASAVAVIGVIQHAGKSKTVAEFGVHEAIDWIDEHCDQRFLQAVVASDYRFLYRGILPEIRVPLIRRESPDLLSLDTYQSPEALAYFQQLERSLQSEPVQPSTGHLATTSMHDAVQWGVATSVWPMGPAHYAWYPEGGLFYPHHGVDKRSGIVVDGVDCGEEALEDALKKDSSEVLVATDCFLAVPATMDSELRKLLRSGFILN